MESTPPGPTITCENCKHEQAVSPEQIMRLAGPEEIIRLAGAILNSRRKEKRGKERVIYKCECGELFSAREFREHETRCDKAPPRSAVLGDPGRYKAGPQEKAQYFKERGLRRKPV